MPAEQKPAATVAEPIAVSLIEISDAKRVDSPPTEPAVIVVDDPPTAGAMLAPDEIPKPAAPPAEPSVGYLVQLGIERGLDPDALKTMMQVYLTLKNREAKSEYDAAMAAFQEECPQPPRTLKATIKSKRTGTTYSYLYAPMDVIDRTISPHIHKHGLSYTFDSEVSENGGMLKAICTVKHEGGHSETSSFTIPIDTADKDPRKYGIARSYACRYALIQALALSSVDPDPDGTPQAAAAVNLTGEQLKEIQHLLDTSGVPIPNFLEAVGAPAVDKIPAGAFQLARTMLRRRLKTQAAKPDEGAES